MAALPEPGEQYLLCRNQTVGEGEVMRIRVRILVDHYDFKAGAEEELIPAVVNYLVGKNIACVL